jgi:AcrR family transcriptional regulator
MFTFSLDFSSLSSYNLNMFKQAISKPKRPETRALILSTALQVFRERGLEASTMRDLAASAKISLGAAYYYFPSKEAIIQAYYDDVQTEHARRMAAVLQDSHLDLNARLRAAFQTKLDILQGDRKLMGALFRFAGEPEHPLSFLGPGTRQNRQQSLDVFIAAIGDEHLPADIALLLPTALWALHMGVLLFFIYDDSPQQQCTRKLVDSSITLLTRLLTLVKLPILKPVRGSVLSILRDAGLVSEGNVSEASAKTSDIEEALERKDDQS